MKKIITPVLISVFLSGCSLLSVHKMDIEQGNIITQEETKRIHLGMSKSQVTEIMGTPVLTNLFAAHQVDYIYTYKPGYGDLKSKKLICRFKGNRLDGIAISD